MLTLEDYLKDVNLAVTDLLGSRPLSEGGAQQRLDAAITIVRDFHTLRLAEAKEGPR